MEEFKEQKLRTYNVNIIISDVEYDFLIRGYSEEEVSRDFLDKLYLTHPSLISKLDENDINIREL